MIRKLLSAVAVAGILVATPTLAAPCKDAKGKFVKCPAAKVAAKPAAKNVVRDKNGKCRVASGANKGKFTKC